MSCDDDIPANQTVTRKFETRVDGVLTDPSVLRFKWRGPEDTTTTTWLWNTDAEVVKESTGKFKVDLNPEPLRPTSFAGWWRGRWEAEFAGGGETAQDWEFRVKAANV